jgi:hypothetical protein
MLVEPDASGAVSTVTGAIRQASQATGTSFSYLLATAQVESGLNPGAGASTSSARGLFQFVDQTWLGTMKQSGAALGYGRYADAITRTASGHYEVKDPTLRGQILKLRSDPTANAVMAGAFTKANATYLAQKLGRPATEGELYIAHFLGAGGAARLISLAASNPNAQASNLFANAAHANRWIFYDHKSGAARTLAEVRNALTDRYDVARSRPIVPTAQMQAANFPTPTPTPPAPIAQAQAANYSASQPLSLALPPQPPPKVPDTAGITNAFAAATPPAHQQNDYQMFRGLFADSGSSNFSVGQLWTVPDAAAHSAKATPSAAGAFNLLDLFKDKGPVADS